MTMLCLLAAVGAGVCLKKFWHWAGSHPEQARQAELERHRRAPAKIPRPEDSTQ